MGRVAFDQFDEARAAKLNAVVTAFKLPPDQVDMLIAAGHDAVKGSSVFNAFLNSMGAAGGAAACGHGAGRWYLPPPGPQEALAQ